jgi:tetratricopeptide (TPR) repeat protein
MQDIQPELIEKYQILLQKDPRSQVFAPLTEAYRKMGMVEEAFRIATRGVQFNPNFGGGRIALARVLLERDNLPGAVDELEKARDLSPDNILAHQLLGECYLKAKQPKEALKSFKMVLFLAPANEKAQRAVRKLESLTADEYDDDVFEMKRLPQFDQLDTESPAPLKPIPGAAVTSGLERALSLADAYIVRGDLERAGEVLRQGEDSFGTHPELIKRLKLVNQRGLDAEEADPVEAEPEQPPPNRAVENLNRKINLLQNLLRRIEAKG